MTILAAGLVHAHAASGVTTSVKLRWTTPGNDGMTGLAAAYDIRYSTAPITPANFASAPAAKGVQAPGTPGTRDSFTVTNLWTGTGYYFAMRTRDAAYNWSAISNVAYESPSYAAADPVTPGLAFSGPRPNPALAAARFAITLPSAGRVRVEAMDVGGRRVRTLEDGVRAAGPGEVVWDLRDETGGRVAPGVYFVRAEALGVAWVRRVVVSR